MTDMLKSQLIDPVMDAKKKFLNMDKRARFNQFLNLGTIVFSALMIWKSLMLITGSESPVVVVLSMYRGDILMLWMPQEFTVGDIVVFQIKGKEIPIIHRVVQTHINKRGKYRILTKGDNNRVDDSWGIYNSGQLWLTKDDIMGKAISYVPQAGFLTIWINESQIVKYIVIGSMCIYVIFFDDSDQKI